MFHDRRMKLRFPLLLCVLIAALSGCATTRSRADQAPRPTSTLTSSATLTGRGGLPFDCPNPSQPVFQPGASISIHPDHGPVGTMVTVAISGLQPGCHLFLDMEVAPILAETSGTPWPAPRQAQTGIQWIQISSAGTVDTTFCVCQLIYFYVLGYPPYSSATPIPRPTPVNVGHYHPLPGDYFFVTVASPDLANPTVFAKFTVTQ
jgi:hypothetical protein